MKELNYKLIISDFDGTLANSNNGVSEEVRNVINEYVANGGIFAVCTGRMLESILPHVRSLGLKGLVVAYQGTVIADIETGKLIKCGGFSAQDTSAICKTLEDIGAFVNAYNFDKLYTNMPAENEYLKFYEKVTGINALHVDMPISDYVLKNDLFCQKVTSLCKQEDKIKIYNALKERLGEKYDVTYSADILVEVSPMGDNKGSALKFLAEYYNIPIEKTVAVGDNLNDLTMIEAAGMGVAVANGTQPLKDKADYITVSNDEGAVARVIEKFGYNND